jgi:hypothetical protein
MLGWHNSTGSFSCYIIGERETVTVSPLYSFLARKASKMMTPPENSPTQALCVVCGLPATKEARIQDSTEIVGFYVLFTVMRQHAWLYPTCKDHYITVRDGWVAPRFAFIGHAFFAILSLYQFAVLLRAIVRSETHVLVQALPILVISAPLAIFLWLLYRRARDRWNHLYHTIKEHGRYV